MASLAPSPRFRAFTAGSKTSAALPLVGGKLWTYAAGTTTPKATFTTAGGTIPNTNPVILDARGEANVWLGTGSYKFVLTDAKGVQQGGPVDNIKSIDQYFAEAKEYTDGVTTSLTQLRTDLASPNPNKGSSMIGYKSRSTGAVDRNTEQKLSEGAVDVADFGADPTGVLDASAAFAAAIATGRPVTARAQPGHNPTIYSGADIEVLDNFDLDSGTWGQSKKVILRLNKKDTGFFVNKADESGTDTNIRTNVRIAGFYADAAPGITGGSFFKQPDKAAYTAHVLFERMETSSKFETSYEGNFIFAKWVDGCDGRDGFPGLTTTTHAAIVSGGMFGQAQRSNLNAVENFHFFYAKADAAVDIWYGAHWSFYRCDWELNDCPPIRAQGIRVGSILNCWMERNAASSLVVLRKLGTGFGLIGSNLWTVQNCHFDLARATGPVFDCDDESFFSGDNNYFVNMGVGVGLGNRPGCMRGSMLSFFNDGPGLTGFLANTPSPTLSENHLHFGPRNLVAEDFAKRGGSDLGILTVPSVLGGKGPAGTGVGTAVQFTFTNFGEAVWIDLPMLMVQFLRGKTISVVASGYGSISGATTNLLAAIWDGVATPTFANPTATARSQTIAVPNGSLQTTSTFLQVIDGSTSLKIGFVVNGNAVGQKVTIENMRLVLGNNDYGFAGH
jgi:hypothetical protein